MNVYIYCEQSGAARLLIYVDDIYIESEQSGAARLLIYVDDIYRERVSSLALLGCSYI
jgi:hypothetical protein